jgi:hypothetical protein
MIAQRGNPRLYHACFDVHPLGQAQQILCIDTAFGVAQLVPELVGVGRPIQKPLQGVEARQRASIVHAQRLLQIDP